MPGEKVGPRGVGRHGKAVGLEGVRDRLDLAMRLNVGNEVPEERQTRQRGLAALEGKGHLRIRREGKRLVDDRMGGLGTHARGNRMLAMLCHVVIEAVAAPHVARRGCWLDEEADVFGHNDIVRRGGGCPFFRLCGPPPGGPPGPSSCPHPRVGTQKRGPTPSGSRAPKVSYSFVIQIGEAQAV